MTGAELAAEILGYESAPAERTVIDDTVTLECACVAVATEHTPDQTGRWLHALLYGTTEQRWRAQDEVRKAVEGQIP